MQFLISIEDTKNYNSFYSYCPKVQGDTLDIAVVEKDRFRHDPYPGLPPVSPELLEAYIGQPHDFEQEFAQLKQRYPELAHKLVTGALDTSPAALQHKRAFAAGVLLACGILSAAVQTEQLHQIFEQSDNPNDDGDGEGRQLSA